MPTIEFENVTKRYGEDTVALDDVSFTISEGEFVILLGPSGAGKSTMLRVLNGLTQPTEGSVRIGDEEIQGNRSSVGMVFQEHYLIESKTAFGNALSGALSRNGLLRSALGMHDDDDKRTALEALQTVGLLDEAGQRAESMSGGQKQRVGIARALVQNPEIVLADEPVASLDPKAARDVMRYLKKAATEQDLTTITSLHQVNIAREFGDRFLGIRDGEVIFDGDADDLTMDEMDRIYYGSAQDGKTVPTGTTSEELGETDAEADAAADGGREA
ncbi:phosphonate ABC transporter ATP-binding protein [Halorubrum sp. SS7]|uniref:Phosphonate ABC transporter ATP-binding protein n=1 Tax=Halorubrum salinarum TaxID=2739057 RepID=A0A7D3XYE1_9EURY|nr:MULTISPECIES: phosphonate ABC transporter ATP-binding protein [Halorubrum]QKG92294.1 phosphonate ABC transporter ATP-binding protein [Halorubrum salinarum]TKX57217.1 phosphonate ABC transporter ATP-binding protein [Halorubrum sp. SS7]